MIDALGIIRCLALGNIRRP